MRYETLVNQRPEELKDPVIGGFALKQGFKEALDGDQLVVTQGISCRGEPYMRFIYEPLIFEINKK